MIIYHEISKESLSKIEGEGLKCTSRGKSGLSDDIIKTDRFLDSYIPVSLAQAGVSRDNNLYGYLGDKVSVINIENGRQTSLAQLASKENRILLRLDVNPSHCYISDLDIYDAIKTHIGQGEADEAWAQRYWHAIIPLQHFALGDIARPEVMITHDIPPRHTHIVTTPKAA
ncbi:MAG TPA: hypothetical protein VFT59_02875 [Candidatus Saccharimonadales bacterium]|nr:hypothetical protein [Candidatus Saccharimonadales bacterium]